jgi:tetratricopeptide (TPR) repeat protein
MSTSCSEGGIEALSPRELFETGRSICEGGDLTAALAYLRRAYDRDGNNARVRSYYGLCVGLSERRFEDSVELCQSAAKQEFFNPELYLNLAKLYLGFGFKAEGVRYLHRGLMIDPGNRPIATLLRDLGDRRSPVLRFLPRRHTLNRWLGTARHVVRLTTRTSRWAA